jgi:hypothetical protein
MIDMVRTYEELKVARRKRWENRLDELTLWETGLLDGYEDGFSEALDEDSEGPETLEEPYWGGYVAGHAVGVRET